MLLRRRYSIWLAQLGTAFFATIDTGLFLVVLALGLSVVALVWIVVLAGAIVVEAFGAEPADDAIYNACPFRAWRSATRFSSTARQTSSDPGGFS